MREFSVVFFFSSRRRHTRFDCDWSSDVCSSDLTYRSPSRGITVHDRCNPHWGSEIDADRGGERIDRKSTRLNSSHSQISYAVFCLKKKKNKTIQILTKVYSNMTRKNYLY